MLVSVITLVALLLTRETRDDSLDDTPVKATSR